MNDESVWNNFSKVYATYMEAFHYPMAQILYDSLNIQNAQNVLEGKQKLLLNFCLVGTGGGYNLREFIIQKPKSCHWVATDISEAMLAVSEQKIEELLKNPFQRVEHNYIQEELPKYESKNIPELNLTYKTADSRDLSQFESNSFDRYYGNQVIGHKIGRDQILKEAFRVLKPEGLLGITAFGRKENCNYVTIIKQTAIEEGIDAAKLPSQDSFELANKEILTQEIEKSGFIIKNSFYVSFPIFEAEQLWDVQLKYQSFQRKQLEQAGADQAMMDKILAAVYFFKFKYFQVKQKYQNILESTKNPVTMEALYIIAVKK